jgi:site-specific recombinase XerC
MNHQVNHCQKNHGLAVSGQNWADYLPINVVKELMGHSNVATTQEYYTQVDKDHEAKAARVIQRLIDSADKGKKSDKTDARLTPECNLHQFEGKK